MGEDADLAKKGEEQPLVLTEQVKEVIKRDILPNGSSDADLVRYLETCRAYGVHPLKRQLYAFKNPKTGKVVIQPTIDGFFAMSEATGEYAGTGETKFEYDENKRLVRATATVYRYGHGGDKYAVTASALYDEFNQQTETWLRLKEVMLEKVALSRCLRRAFPTSRGGLYTREEFQPEREETTVVEVHPVSQTPSSVAPEPFAKQFEVAAEARMPVQPPEPNDVDTQNSGNPLTDHAPPHPVKPAAKKLAKW